MEVKIAVTKDINVLSAYDKHITKAELINLVRENRVFIIEDDNKFIGWLRYNLFWDNTPFMNMIFLLEEYRGRGFGKQVIEFWEEKMIQLGYTTAMTSTASDEYAQHFYNKLDYETIGGFLIKGDPYEVILYKELK